MAVLKGLLSRATNILLISLVLSIQNYNPHVNTLDHSMIEHQQDVEQHQRLSSRDPLNLNNFVRSPPQDTHVASAPILFAHQPPPQLINDWRNQQLSSSSQRNRWNHSPYNSALTSQADANVQINEPLNLPQVISQEGAKRLEQYMRGYVDGNNQTPLNLASINDRAPANVAELTQLQSTSKPMKSVRMNPSLGADLINQGQSFQMTPPLKQQPPIQQRSDLFQNGLSDTGKGLVRKGKVDNVVVHKNYPMHNIMRPASPSKKLIRLDISQDCITRSATLTSSCEDRLIKRLHQDATEGRTVEDVSRRVCCALFWHKDCISSIVVDTCPDSSPVAASILTGSRKLDLTLSCQRFNRDGCNGAQSRFRLSELSLSMGIVLSLCVLVNALSCTRGLFLSI